MSEQRAWDLYVPLVAASLHVDYDGDGAPPLVGKQPAYVDLATLAFQAARAFEYIRVDQVKQQAAARAELPPAPRGDLGSHRERAFTAPTAALHADVAAYLSLTGYARESLDELARRAELGLASVKDQQHTDDLILVGIAEAARQLADNAESEADRTLGRALGTLLTEHFHHTDRAV